MITFLISSFILLVCFWRQTPVVDTETVIVFRKLEDVFTPPPVALVYLSWRGGADVMPQIALWAVFPTNASYKIFSVSICMHLNTKAMFVTVCVTKMSKILNFLINT